ncbi:conserved hypothetical protein; putative signal peptide [Bradyrhizobium sp. ORS 278]|uniref:hypothetical protein n=1 Tax=Bradyrhizobium sp. (strain ORS 278) TaxID=114615 RepID=UPI0001508035|nr:hypothetical protein [Bradyrhizobium sp. ORS 278]CAL77746.1 conserved hypothetical protein; putative signal peptide [Bradyrhizobium sp. ORS 278]
MAITIPARASAILLLTGLVLGGSAVARAQEVDCAAVQGSATPIEMRYHRTNGALVIIQSDRASHDNFTVWSRTETPQGVIVSRSTFVGGLMSESQDTTNFGGTIRTYHKTYAFEGLPGDFDRKSDIDYKIIITTRMQDGSTTKSVVLQKYRFKYASTRKVGPCELVIVHATAEVEIPPSPVKNHIAQVYLPELNLGAGDPIEPTIEGVTTSFVPITPLQ